MRSSFDEPYLLIPGPTPVAPSIAAAATRPMISHRGREMRDLVGDLLGRLRALLATDSEVYTLGTSATGAMEAAVRNAAPGPFLHLVGGAFGGRWSDIREACGLEGDRLEVPWGRAFDPDAVRDALGRRRYAAVTLVHSETSTGVLNPLEEIGAVVGEFEETLLLVDTVTSMTAVPLELDAWGVDLCLAGVQKAWALPPGLTICAVSAAALERSRRAPAKGYHLDWSLHHSALEEGQTLTTPPLSLMFQLQAQLDRIEAEGLAARYSRHRDLQARVAAWAEDRFELFAEEGHRSPTLTPLRMEGYAVDSILEGMRDRGWILGAGCGRSRDQLIRIGHMGEMRPEILDAALRDLDGVLEGARERR